MRLLALALALGLAACGREPRPYDIVCFKEVIVITYVPSRVGVFDYPSRRCTQWGFRRDLPPTGKVTGP